MMIIFFKNNSFGNLNAVFNEKSLEEWNPFNTFANKLKYLFISKLYIA